MFMCLCLYCLLGFHLVSLCVWLIVWMCLVNSVDVSGLRQLLDDMVSKLVEEFLQPVRNGLIARS